MGIPCGAVIDQVSLELTMKPRSFHSTTIPWPPCIQSDHYRNGVPGKKRSLSLRDGVFATADTASQTSESAYISFPASETLELRSDRTVLPSQVHYEAYAESYGFAPVDRSYQSTLFQVPTKHSPLCRSEGNDCACWTAKMAQKGCSNGRS